MKKELITLAKELDFQTVVEYFDYFTDSYHNGNFSSLKVMIGEIREAEGQNSLIARLEEMEQSEVIGWIARN